MNQPVALIGVSAAIRAVEDEIERAAQSDAKVLITGESGVGKEVVARLIHARSARSIHPLVTINCAGFSDTLLESELFGHVKGSFTDAHRNKAGWLEAAHRGTIFMDEVGEMSLRMQALLLRFLETGEIQRVGAERPVRPLNVRVITATHRRLLTEVAAKTFREDLYYRLNVINIAVPPLRERREDVYVLLQHFLREVCGPNRPIPAMTPEALKFLIDYHWPGNVRELRNVAERMVVRAKGGSIDIGTLPVGMLDAQSAIEPLAREQASAAAHAIFRRLLERRGTFWTEAYEPFMARDLARHDVRALVRLGLEHTRGSYKLLVREFNMPLEDYKKFLKFLRKHQCHVAFQQYRVMPEDHEWSMSA